MTLIEEITKRENLLAAWLKVKNHLLEYEGWVDIEATYSFEAALEVNLKLINDNFLKGIWSLQKMIPLPRLKIEKKDKVKQEETIRQDFWVPIIDQVAWVAVVNIIGPIVDYQMPSWGLANRLYRSAFYEDSKNGQEREELKIGPYRHSAGLLYRKWHVSWSLYRRLAYLTWSRMTKGSRLEEEIESFSEGDKRVFWNYIDSLKVPFIEEDYWPKLTRNNVFWAKIDFSHFFPRLEREVVLKGIMFGLNNFSDYGEIVPEFDKVEQLLRQLLDFCWEEPNWSSEDKEKAFLDKKDKGIPVGLLVSGFLANAALLPIESDLVEKLRKQTKKRVAHFRYVDDHLFLSNDFKTLLLWIKEYEDLVKEIGISFKWEKTEPESLKKYLTAIREKKGIQEDETFIVDSQNPRQFTTQTLALVSDIANKDFGLLHLDEQESLMQELKHLLKIPLQDDEIRNDTRMSFAIYRIIRLILDWQRDWSPILNLRRESITLCEKGKEFCISVAKAEEIKNKKSQEEKEYNKKVKEAYRSLVGTLKISPERLRLWRLLIEFCRRTGYDGSKEIVSLLKKKRQYKFFKAILWLELGNAIMKSTLCLKNASEIKIFSWEIDQQKRFLTTIDSWLQCCRIEPKADAYERISWGYLRNCIKLSEYLINIKPLRFSVKKPILFYWAELNITSRHESQPSQIWMQNIKKLNSKDPITVALMKMYPRALKSTSPSRFKRIIKETRERKTGWEWDGGSFTRNKSNRMDLVEWCNWTQKKQNECNVKGSYDPRISEWTALEITRKIVEIYQGKNLNQLKTIVSDELLPHPGNFTLLAETKADNEKPYTWEAWEKKIKLNERDFIQVVDKRYRIKFDNRTSPFWLSNNTFDQTEKIICQLYGIGLILLGLMRKDFSWPARWNLPAYAKDWRSIGKEWFSSFACSTNTLGILEAILLPRNIESKRILLQQIKYPFDSDVLYDPNPILDLSQLQQSLIKAQEELVKDRITSINAMPRQLVPIDMRFLLKREWLKYEDSD